MTVDDLIVYGKGKISSTHAKMLLAILLNLSTLELLTRLDEIVSDDIVNDYKDKVERIKNNEPLQYVVGTVNFYGNILKVNNKVLIPRFETEELVENVLNYIKYEFPDVKKVIDLGCGSGAIGLTIKQKLNNLDVTLLDISDDALSVAKENAFNLGLDVNFVNSNMWENVNGTFDVVISNPPYIRTNEVIQDIVKENEPHLALYAGEDGLDCFRLIRKDLLNHINKSFLLAMEIGDLQKDDVTDIFSDIADIKIVCKKDLQGRDRMIFVIKK